MSKFKNLFFVEEGQTTPVAPVEAPQIEKKSFQTPAVAPVSAVSTPSAPASVANDDIVAQIWDAIIGRNLPGPDYLELRNNASALEGLPLTEEQRLEAAFKVLNKTYPTFSKDVILKSIDTYVGVVNEEKKNGLAQCNEVRKTSVGEKEVRLAQLKETSADILKQIESLKKEYDATNANINTMEHEILTTTQELDAKEKTFVASVDTVLTVLNTDKQKISTLNF